MNILGLSLELILAGITVISVIIYALSGGADFGGGMWDLLAFGPRKQEQRKAISKLIGPIWEANHVWLILVIVLLFTIFPTAYTRMMTVLFIPLMLILVGIVLRGAGYAFKQYDPKKDKIYYAWSKVFGIASFLTPFFLGITLGSLASGNVGDINAFVISCGLFSQGLFAFLAAVYIAADLQDDLILRGDFRRRALISALSLAPAAVLVYYLASEHAVYLFQKLNTIWAPYLLSGASLAALLAIYALIKEKYETARYAAAMQVAIIISGWSLAQFPYLIIPSHSIYDSHAPLITMQIVLIALALGGLLLIPSLFFLFYLFDRKDSKSSLHD